MTDFEIAAAAFSDEVDREAARLVEIGTPPWEAIRDARSIVGARRQRKAREREMERETKRMPHD